MKKISFILITVAILLILIFIYFYFNNRNKKMNEDVKKVNFVTRDGVTIVANYYPNQNSKFAAILIHMRPKTKESFDDFAKLLQKEGYTALAIDLRGHGDSVESIFGKLDYQKFNLDEEKKSIDDLVAASLFLEKNGYPKENQFLVGASIGANLSFQFLSENPEIKAVVLLSPGLNYRNVILENFKKENLDDKIFIISSKNDLSSISGARELKKWYPKSKYLEFNSAEHGTDLLDSYPDLKNEIIYWLREKLI